MAPPNWSGLSVRDLHWELFKYRHVPWHPYYKSSWAESLESLIVEVESDEEGSESHKWWCWPPLVRALRAAGMRCRKCAPVHDYGEGASQGLPSTKQGGKEVRWIGPAYILKARPLQAGETCPVRGELVWKAAWKERTPQGRCLRQDGLAILREGKWSLEKNSDTE